ncbi:hypothetical protein [Faecalibaculum rodentium]|jgi:hypothetical protein|uniref:hypothetical protein n=1 Tax=Faecalibaculum rodentium TaxID=1702221 RepID=UPI0008337A83|nr:hypothetical protein [Faecalibaculum rodentium]
MSKFANLSCGCLLITSQILGGCTAKEPIQKTSTVSLQPVYEACQSVDGDMESTNLSEALDSLESCTGVEVSRGGYTWQILRDDSGVSTVQIGQSPDTETWTVDIYSKDVQLNFVLIRETDKEWSLQQILSSDNKESADWDWDTMIWNLLFPGISVSDREECLKEAEKAGSNWQIPFTSENGADCLYEVTMNSCGLPATILLQSDGQIIWSTDVKILENGTDIQSELAGIAVQVGSGDINTGESVVLPN